MRCASRYLLVRGEKYGKRFFKIHYAPDAQGGDNLQKKYGKSRPGAKVETLDRKGNKVNTRRKNMGPLIVSENEAEEKRNKS